MKRLAILAPLMALNLAGCDLLFPEDPRLGDEAEDQCVARLTSNLTYERYQELQTATGTWVPTYTYDITKLDFAAIKELTVKGSDDTAGTRLMRETNETSTAVERFMAMEVSEKGAFFLGREPALYRVRGERQPAATLLATGCARQITNMRLIAVDWIRPTRKVKIETLQAFNEIEKECEVLPYNLVETEGEVRLTVPQATPLVGPLSDQEFACVEKLLEERLNKKLEK